MKQMTRRQVSLTGSILAFASLLIFSGCSRTGPNATQPDAPRAVTQTALPAGVGLEAHFWLTQADDPALTKTMQSYAERDGQVSPESRRLWIANGLRIYAIPADQAATVEAALRAGADSTQHQALPADAQWVEIVRGPPRDAGQTIALEAERLRLGPGALRLLARCWAIPLPPQEGAPDAAPAREAALHIDLVPQHAEIRRGSSADDDQFTSRATSINPAAAGLVFDRLMLSLVARDGDAYVVIPEHPGAEWAAPENEPASHGVHIEEEARAAPKVGRVVRGRAAPGAVDAFAPASVLGVPGVQDHSGPRSLGAPTLGQAMLMGESAQGRGSRVVLVLVPRVPRTFNLTGD